MACLQRSIRWPASSLAISGLLLVAAWSMVESAPLLRAYGSPLALLSKPSERTRPPTHDDTLTATQASLVLPCMPSYAWGYGNQDMVGAVGGKAESGVLPAVALLEINAMRRDKSYIPSCHSAPSHRKPQETQDNPSFTAF